MHTNSIIFFRKKGTAHPRELCLDYIIFQSNLQFRLNRANRQNPYRCRFLRHSLTANKILMSIITLLFSPIQQSGKISTHNSKKAQPTLVNRALINVFIFRSNLQLGADRTNPNNLLSRIRLYNRILAGLSRTAVFRPHFPPNTKIANMIIASEPIHIIQLRL